MIRLATQAVAHLGFVGGVGLAVLVARKKRAIDCNNMATDDGPLKKIKRALKGPLCNGCMSCQSRGCFFAFQRYPSCFLAR